MRDLLMRDFQRVESHQIRISWVINGVSGHGDWFDWSSRTEANLLAHIKENIKHTGGDSMLLEIRAVVEMRKKNG